MKNFITRAASGWVLLALLCPFLAQTQNTRPAQKSPREFVEGFYQWYVARIHSEEPMPNFPIALENRASDFSPQLTKLLKADMAAQEACAELVGIDFDPLLYSQDPDDRYEVGKITQKGESYLAEIYGLRDDKPRGKPDLLAEFTKIGTHWSFVNFHYPGGGDLLTMLRLPRPPCGNPRHSGK